MAASLALVVFAALGPVFASTTFDSDEAGPTAFILVWCVLWVAIVVAQALPVWLGTFGTEVVEQSGGRLRLRRSLGPWRRERDLDAGRVEELRVEEAPSRRAFGVPGAQLGRWLGVAGPTIAATYGAQTQRFGVGLDPAEAAIIVRRLRGARA